MRPNPFVGTIFSNDMDSHENGSSSGLKFPFSTKQISFKASKLRTQRDLLMYRVQHYM